MAHAISNVFENRFTSAKGHTKKFGLVNYLYVCILTSTSTAYLGYVAECEQRRSLRILCNRSIITNIYFPLINVRLLFLHLIHGTAIAL